MGRSSSACRRERWGTTDDANFRWVIDVGLTGPDKGTGGDYLFVPPRYKGSLPATGYHVAKPRTNRLLVFYRAFVEKGDIAAAVSALKAKAAIFPLSQAAKLPVTNFVDISGVKLNTISANDYGSPRSWAAATSSSTVRRACSMHASRFSTTRRA